MDKLLNQINPEWVLYGLAAGLVVLWLRGVNRTVADGVEVATGLPGAIFQGAASGLLGIPRTDTPEAQTKCIEALAAGDDWAASFYCPAAKWAGGLFDGK